MLKIIFKYPEEARDWVEQNVTQNDPRYLPDLETLNILAYFLYNRAVNVEEMIIPELSEPSNGQLDRISEPQKYYKYIALGLLKLQGIKEEDIKFEFPFYGRRVDVYANKNRKEILVECCSCYVQKIIQYLENDNTELWIITSRENVLENDPNSSGIKWFILKRGENWSENYNKYKNYRQKQLRKVKNPLDNL